MRKQSSLVDRTRPTSVTPPHTISTLAPVACLNSHPCLCACTHASTPKALRKGLNPTDYSHLSHTRTPANCPVLCDLRGLPLVSSTARRMLVTHSNLSGSRTQEAVIFFSIL